MRLAHARAALSRGDRCWESPRVRTWAAWLESRAAPILGERKLRLLGPAEEWLLWRRVLPEIAGGDVAAAGDGIVDGICRAARLAADWRIPIEAMQGAPGSSTALLVRALRRFEEHCRDLRVVARHRLSALAPPAGESDGAELVGFLAPTAAQRTVSGARFGLAARLAETRHRGLLRLASAADENAEIGQAAAWCRARLEEDGRPRLLVVVPDLAARRHEVWRRFAQTLAPGALASPSGALPPGLIAHEGGEPLSRYPLVICALELLGLAAHETDFERASTWLRAAHHSAVDPLARARLDLWLRRRARTELDLRWLALEASRAPPELREAAERCVNAWTAALAALEGGRTGPAGWATRFAAALAAAGWPGSRALSSEEQQTRERFELLLREFAAVAALGRSFGLEEAVALLRDIASRTSFQPATGDPAVTLTDALCDPVVAYDGIWVTGLHAETWPLPVAADPFLPVAAQRAAGVPEASLEGQLAFARQLLGRLRAASGELVVSRPAQRDEGRTTPSPLLAEWDGATSLDPPGEPVSPAMGLRAGSSREAFCDEVGVPWEAGLPMPAGTYTLELQSRCAFRAYAELRLGADPLPRPRRGIAARARGQLLHRALELLWRELRDQAALLAARGMRLETCIECCVREAAAEIFAGENDSSRLRLTAREQRRARRLLAELCELESVRAPFRVAATEHPFKLQIGRARLDVRIDRIDEVPDLGRVVIDYKSGQAAGSRDWFGERPRHPQLLAYREAVGADARLLALACIGRREVAFRGIGQDAAGMRGVEVVRGAGEDPAAVWSSQTRQWSAMLAGLATAFLEGRAASDPAPGACDACHLHCFCRIASGSVGRDDGGA